MSRSLVRSLSVLALVLILTLISVATPATAGQLGGGGFPHALQPGQCEFTQNPITMHFFVAHGTSRTSTNTNSSSGNQQTFGNVIVIGPLLSLPPDVQPPTCTFIPTIIP